MNPDSLARRFGALSASLAGLMDITSALYPGVPSRIELLRDFLPLTVLRMSNTAAVMTGFALILVADGLRKRRRRAMHLTVALLVWSAAVNLTKGLDVEEATVSIVLCCLLLAGRGGFDVRGATPVPRQAAQQILGFTLLFVCYVLTGFLVLRHALSPAPTVFSALEEPVRLIVGTPHFHYLTSHARWFGRSLVAAGGLGCLFVLAQLLRPLIPRRVASEEDLAHARTLVERYGTDTLSYFALQEGRSYFFEPDHEAMLSYRLWGTVAVVGGNPLGNPERIGPLLRNFMDFATAHGIDLCFLGVSGDVAPALRSIGMRLLKIGEEAIVDLQSFEESRLKRKVRRAGRHVESQGIRARCYRAANLPAAISQQVEEVSRQWVDAKGGVEQGFSMTLGRVPRESDPECEILVAAQGQFVWGYLSLVPAESGSSWSLDAMRRRQNSPNGLMEFLILSAATMYRDRGCRTLSLNFATLADTQGELQSRALAGTQRFLWKNLSSVYQLKSLYLFNSKFDPQWRSRYLAYREVRNIPKLAIAVTQCEAPMRSLVAQLWPRRD